MSHLIHHHDLGFTLVAIVVLAIGATLTMRTFARVRRTSGAIKYLWLFLTGMVGGGTVWSTHFLAMIAYEPGVPVTYHAELTALSLLVSFICVTAGFFVAAATHRSVSIEVGGLVVGMGIAAMHYIGMAAMIVDAPTVWNFNIVAISVVLAGFFGAVATNRVARPVTKFCKYGGTTSFFLAVALLHFVGMGALTIEVEGVTHVHSDHGASAYLGLSVLVVSFMVMAAISAAYSIDIRNTKETKSKIRHLALHDPLTGLPNRARAEEILASAVGGDLDDTAQIAVAAIHLERIKEIGDVHGPGSGDTILKDVAKRLHAAMEDGEFVARIGGDLFVAIKYPIYMERQTKGFCERIDTLIQQPISLDKKEVTLDSSIGYAHYPDAGESVELLLHRAKVAMAYGQQNGSGEITAFVEGLDDEMRDRSSLAIDLKRAIKNDELELFYQLQNDTKTCEVVGAEALLRWNHPEKGRVSPGIFIPIAEENGLIGEIGDWVLFKACEDAIRWEMPYTVAVNVASQQLSDAEFPAKVQKALDASGLEPSRLEIEVTETGIIADVGFVLNVLNELKAIGVKIAMDDYGTGYSSLSTLQSFPFDKIKIDQEFICGLPDNGQSSAIVQATIILGASLGMPVLAEGVETQAQLDCLAEAGCATVQGFLFGKPMPGEEFLQLTKRLSRERLALLREAS